MADPRRALRRAAAVCLLAMLPAAWAQTATPPGTVITNVVEARWTTGSTPATVSAQHQLTTAQPAAGVADLAITKVGPAEAAAGNTITWRLLVRNNGSGAAEGAQVVDVVPPQVGNLAVACRALTAGVCGATSIGAAGASGTPISVGITQLPVGGQIEVSVTGTLAANATTFTNQASVSVPGTVDPTPADNTAQATTQVISALNPVAALRGRVWLDLDHDRARSAGEPLLAGFVVRLYAPDGTTLVAQTTTSADGEYAFTNLAPGLAYQLEFRDPSGLTVFGLPVTTDGGGAPFAATATCGQTDGTIAGSFMAPAAGGTCYSLTRNGSTARVTGNGRTIATLQAGDTLLEQSLPLDPTGVVYDAVTRQPVTGAKVTLQGPPAFDPALHLLGGADNATQTTGELGVYQFLLLGGAPNGVYRLLVEPPAQYVAPSSTLPAAPMLDPTGRGSHGVYLVQPQSTAPALPDDTTHHTALDLAGGDPQVLNNHLPIDPIAAAGAPLLLAKSANKAVAAIGDLVQYRLNLSNSGSSDLTQIEVTDRLPPGLRYRTGSLRIDGAAAPDPQRSADGRSLTIRLPRLAAGASSEIRYVVEIGPGTAIGPAINVAQARAANGAPTLPARATVTVEDELFRQRITLLGRVIEIDSCTERDEQGREREVEFDRLAAGRGIRGARVYLQDGSTVRTDREGKWHVEGQRPGTHVVQLDVDSLPPGYEPVLCQPNTRHAGQPFSQFVQAQGGTLARADFYVRKSGDGARAAEAGHQLAVVPTADGARLTLTLKGTAAVEALTATLMLPPGVELIGDSARIDGKAASVERNDNLVSARLGARSSEWTTKLELTVRGKPAAPAVVRAVTQLRASDGAAHPLPVVQAEWRAAPTRSDAGRLDYKIAAAPAPAATEEKDPLESTNALYAAGAEQFDIAWLAAAAPGFEIVYPPPTFNPGVRATKVLVKHAAEQRIELLMNGEPVHPLNHDGMDANATGTVALSRWGGVPLREGRNRLVAIAYNRDGAELARTEREIRFATGAVEARLLPKESQLVADGRTPPLIALSIIDADGQPARPGLDGTVRISAPYQALSVQKQRDARPLLDDPGNEPRWRVGTDGIARIHLEPTTTSGEVVLTFNFPGREPQLVRAWLKPELRDWILVGFAEGTVGYRHLSGNVEPLTGAERDDELYTDGQVAFYAKGKVRGDWLLTLAYDSDKERTRRGGDSGDRLGQLVDRKRYYTLYGDATSVQNDAASVRKLYLKIERQQFYAMFGDFDTALTVTDLARYSRTINGIKSEYRGETLSYSAFATRDAQAFVKDELRGDGTSGSYRLSRTNILANTEKVVLETRDRFRPEVVLAAEPLARGVDYDIDYSAGSIFLRRPLPSRDQAFNPIFIVVDYEAEDASRDERTTAGGRVAVKLGGRVEIGATHLHEGSGVRGALSGVDATLQIDEHTRLKAEFAQSRRDAASAALATPAAGAHRGDAYLVEVRRQDKELAASVYARGQEAGFGLGQQRAAETGLAKVGGDLSLRLSDRLRLNAQAYNERVETGTADAERTLIEARLNLTDNYYGLYTGVRAVRDDTLEGERRRAGQLVAGGNYRLLGGRLNLRLDLEANVVSGIESADFPHRLRLGADYKLTEKIGLFADQEFAYGEREKAATTRLGVRSTPWQGAEAASSVNLGLGPDGAGVATAIGLTQNLRVSEKLSFSAGVDRTHTLREPGDKPLKPNTPSAQGADSLLPSTAQRPAEDFTSIFGGVAFNDGPWGATLRLEQRNGDTADRRNVAASVHRDLNLGEALAASVLYTDTEMRGLTMVTESRLDLRLSYARRPIASRWIVLNRFDVIHEERDRPEGAANSRRVVNNFNANWQPDWRTQLSLHYGIKYVLETLDGQEASGTTDVVGAELRRDLGNRFDIGARGALLRSWRADTRTLSYGLSVGTWPIDNLWLGIGYNFAGFRDTDFAGAGNTAKGWYLSFRFKFDQGQRDPAAQRRLMFDEAAR